MPSTVPSIATREIDQVGGRDGVENSTAKSGFPLLDLDAPPPKKGQLEGKYGRMLVRARTDIELARAFLKSKTVAVTTQRRTKIEIGRFLLWCDSKGLKLDDLLVEELVEYREFLLDPQPREKWVSLPALYGKTAFVETDIKNGERDDDPTSSGVRWPREHALWRPFSGPLTKASTRLAFRIAKEMLEFGVRVGYLRLDPGSIVENVKAPTGAANERYLGASTLAYIDAALDDLAIHTPAQRRAVERDKFLFKAFLTTGARLSEINAARMGDVYEDDNQRWWIKVIGKGSKPREVPVVPELLKQFQAYRVAFGMAPTTHKRDRTPLVLSLRRKGSVGVTGEATANAIKAVFGSGADRARAAGDDAAAINLDTASTHWLRHEMMTMFARNVKDLVLVRDHAGHADISTTNTYLHTDANTRHDAVMELMEKVRPQ